MVMGWKKLEIEIDTDRLESALNWFHEAILRGLFGGVGAMPDGLNNLGAILSKLKAANEDDPSWCCWWLSAEEIRRVANDEDLLEFDREITDDELHTIAHAYKKAIEYNNDNWLSVLAESIEGVLRDG